MLYFTSENLIFHFLLAIPTFFTLRWLLRKVIKNDRHRLISAWAGTIILTPLVYLATIFVFFSILFHQPTKDFDKAKWVTDSSKRYQMAENIIKNNILIGKDKNQVLQILGNPTYKYPQTNQWNYNMGTGPAGLGIMFHALIINFDTINVISVYHGKIQD